MPRDVVVRGVLVTLMLSAPLARAQDVEPGRRVFAGRCANCHGTEGAGGELGPSIVGRVPLRNDQELEAVIREGVPGSGMPAFPTLARAEATDLVAFLRTLHPRSSAGPRRANVTITGGRTLEGIVLNQSHGELQLLGDDRAVHLLRETTKGQYREVTSQTDWPAYNGQTERQPLQPAHGHHRRERRPPWCSVDLQRCRTPPSCR